VKIGDRVKTKKKYPVTEFKECEGIVWKVEKGLVYIATTDNQIKVFDTNNLELIKER
jgi:hypothetical protein